MFKYKNGDYIRDAVSGFSGCIIARSDHLTGCNRYCVQPELVDGKFVDPLWIDETSLIQEQKTRLELARDPGPPG